MTVPLDLARPRVIQPGLLPLMPGHERYWVRPGGTTTLELNTGDRCSGIERFGAQSAEVTVLGHGSEDFEALGLPAEGPATVLRALDDVASAFSGSHTGRVVATLAGRGLRPDQANAAVLFGDWSPAGARETFVAQRDVTVITGVPTWKMLVDEQNPPSDVMIEVMRANPRERPPAEAPEPLAEPILDIRIDNSTAQSYEVKAGQFIQVIDVEGRQCSDFLAFDARRLAD